MRILRLAKYCRENSNTSEHLHLLYFGITSIGDGWTPLPQLKFWPLAGLDHQVDLSPAPYEAAAFTFCPDHPSTSRTQIHLGHRSAPQANGVSGIVA